VYHSHGKGGSQCKVYKGIHDITIVCYEGYLARFPARRYPVAMLINHNPKNSGQNPAVVSVPQSCWIPNNEERISELQEIQAKYAPDSAMFYTLADKIAALKGGSR